MLRVAYASLQYFSMGLLYGRSFFSEEAEMLIILSFEGIIMQLSQNFCRLWGKKEFSSYFISIACSLLIYGTPE